MSTPLEMLTVDEREVVRRSMEATFFYFDRHFHTRLGVTQEEMRSLLRNWPDIDDANDDSDAALAINNSLNDLLHGVGIADERAFELTGANRAEMRRIYSKWAGLRGWTHTSLRPILTSITCRVI